jgi:hypothetical protein
MCSGLKNPGATECMSGNCYVLIYGEKSSRFVDANGIASKDWDGQHPFREVQSSAMREDNVNMWYVEGCTDPVDGDKWQEDRDAEREEERQRKKERAREQKQKLGV